MYLGEDQILQISQDGTNFYPIGCLTENGFSETCDMLETTTTDNGGWKTSRPTNQSYSISFSGIQELSNVSPQTIWSLDLLRLLKRNRARIHWKILTNTSDIVEVGYGYIKDLSESAPVGDWLTFDGTIEGYGAPNTSEDLSDNFVFDSTNNYNFNN